MDCGIFHTPYNLPNRSPKQLFEWSLDMARTADEAGFRDFLIGEHFTLARENIPCPDSVIAAAATMTETLRFAPMAHLLPYHDPATLAVRVAWLSRVLEDRYYLGVAPGGHHTDAILHGYDGIAPLPPRQLEALHLMERVWKNEPFQEIGEYFQAGFPGPDNMPGYHVEIADSTPWPGMEIAVTGLSANSNSMKFAGERNYTPISFFGGTEQMRLHYETWAAAMESKGHTPERKRFSICREVFVADTDAEAKRLALKSGMAESWEHYLFPIYKKFNLFPGIIADSGKDLSPDDLDMDFLADHVWLCGSPETVAEKIAWVVEKAGSFGQLCVNSHDSIDDPEPTRESLRRLSQEVMPLLDK
ncbi:MULTISPECIES: LLM class flavin-dependent oxidoreductase [Sphingopyxis]|uniref:Baeyer-Villiger monooxygenase n=1 Tax=Sphingopyxis granuli TaxID=267128 RepID=A0AA86L544_9SPHN|nr:MULTISPECIES: LLM class flavin-dependent oxidoreductase [Sphingopyxis]AMG75625.1 Baeyer-Villiger monooxygenase [Sphingopyxis granuli]HEV7312538.1 LLM class flavin-dependent oxidoreductase [Sphingopyxis sp.]